MKPIARLGLMAASTLALVAGTVGIAHAMGTGNPYLDEQVGVSYTVYQPSFTAGLKINTADKSVSCPAGTEANLTVAYGTHSKRHFTVSEAGTWCRDIGVGATVLTTTIQGAQATVVAYCDPSTDTKPTKADVKKCGGHLSMTLPGKAPYKQTNIRIETFGKKNLSADDLVKIANSLQPVG